MNTTVEKFAEWAIVEIMGHKRFAGHVTEQAVGGASFVRIDVPEISLPTGDVLPAFTKLFGAASIYCISPCTEETARLFAASIRAEGFSRYEVPKLDLSTSRSHLVHEDDPDEHEDNEDARETW